MSCIQIHINLLGRTFLLCKHLLNVTFKKILTLTWFFFNQIFRLNKFQKKNCSTSTSWECSVAATVLIQCLENYVITFEKEHNTLSELNFINTDVFYTICFIFPSFLLFYKKSTEKIRTLISFSILITTIQPNSRYITYNVSYI